MKRLYARIVLWLIGPALDLKSKRLSGSIGITHVPAEFLNTLRAELLEVIGKKEAPIK